MRIIISPAKKMREDPDGFASEGLPRFLPEAERLKERLLAMSYDQRKALWRCSDAIARQNAERLEHMDLNTHLTPAVLAYEGIQYRYMAPGVFETGQLRYIQDHLRILSGFYGLLRPFDGVVPYRLEMQAPLAVDGCRDLYAFWGDKLARALAEETDTVLNLASREYSRAVEPHLPAPVSFVTCTFGELQGDRVVEKGTLCKMARGEMVRWMAVHQITRVSDLTGFQALGYRFSPAHSNQTHLVFLKGEF